MRSSFVTCCALLTLTAGCKPDAQTEDVGDETAETSGTPEDTGETGETGDTGEPEPNVDWPTLTCDSLVPEYCSYPFPNNVFTQADAGTPTGRRLALSSAGLPVSKAGNSVDPSPFNHADGFSTGAALLATLPGATATGLPSWTDLDASLAADSPTILLDTVTGERIPHFAELDSSTNLPGETLFIRPVLRLEPGRRYIAAIRNVVDSNGSAIAASPGFAALRDRSETDDEGIEARRPLYTDIFARLGEAGVEREQLQLAWDFTTASDENKTATLIGMIADAEAWYQDNGPGFTIDSVDTDFNPQDTLYRVRGTITVPLYLEAQASGAPLVRDDEGLAVRQGTAEYPFLLLIPVSAQTEPATLLQYGHGLFGNRNEAVADNVRRFANDYGHAVFAVDWIGQSQADQALVGNLLSTGEAHLFAGITDSLHQAMVNFTIAAKVLRDGVSQDPQFVDLIDASELNFLGISQGGIMGGAYMTISPDIQRGVLGVPAQPFNLILNRSTSFDLFLDFLLIANDDARGIQMFLQLAQILWDGVESNGYTHRLQDEGKEVLIRAGIGDHQVTTLGAHFMARTIGATHLDTGLREVWGLESTTGEHVGSTYVEYGFGLPMDPIGNVPQTACTNPHGLVRELAEAQQQADVFFRSGVVEDFCSGACEFPELGACD
jgi:hypothetical protein